MSYDEIRPLSFRLRTDLQSFPCTCSVLRLDTHFKKLLRETLADAKNRPVEEVRLPIAVLNKAIRMLIPDITSIAPNADLESTPTWLYGYGDMPASIQAIRLIIGAWIRTAFSNVPEQQRDFLLNALADCELRWDKQSLDLAQWKVNGEGTAMVPKQQQDLDGFLLLPDLIATRLSQDHLQFRWAHEKLSFRRVPSYGREIELISWPPLEYTNKEGSWPYSVIITLSQQVIPFQSYPLLNCEVGIRRWAGPPISRLPGKEETSVYLTDRVPWISGFYHTRSFQVASVRWEYIPADERQEGDAKHRLVWNSGLVQILDDLHIKAKDKFPTPEELRANPRDAIKKDGTPSAAIVYRNGIYPSHPVGPGLMPVDRYVFAEQIVRYVGQELIFIPPYKRKEVKVTIPPSPFFYKETKIPADVSEQRRQIIAVRENTTALVIEIWHQSIRVLHALIAAVEEFLGCPSFQEEGTSLFSQTPELSIRIFPHLLGPMGGAISFSFEKKERRQERFREALRQRVRTIEKALPSIPRRILAFIELDDAEWFQNDDDPKPALRKGFASGLRLNQFITPYHEDPEWSDARKKEEQEKLAHRAESAVRDLFRQLGLLVAPPIITIKKPQEEISLPTPLHYLGLWMIKQYRKSSMAHVAQLVPVFVHMDTLSTDIVTLASGFKEWLPYPDALLALAQDRYLGYKQPEDVLRFIMTTLQRYLPRFKDTLLCCHAQNLQGVWPWLTNDQITKRLPPSLAAYPGLRIVRQRTGEHETAEWYAQSETEPYGFSKGVFQIGEQVFASIADKPPAGQRPKDLSMLSPRIVEDKQGQIKTYKPNPTKPAWNPGISEMTFCGNNPAEAGLYVALVNQLRYGFATHYDYPTVLPFPLPLAKLMEEYVLPLPGEEQ